ncbi:hypothetical protein FZP68_05840 [Methanothermobacter sp. THM-2]|nr:hypothetical protein FZP68_05840 [Methanothermobacter sp. THM-2]WBF10631.1 hypothetical protein ISG34_01130 [Methanothermobacter marburgensis]
MGWEILVMLTGEWSLPVAAVAVLVLTPAAAAIISLFKNSNLYTDVRGGTPRGAGIVPWAALSIFTPPPFNVPLAVMGALAFIDDLAGRRRIMNLSIEWGQLSRGLGILAVALITYPFMGAWGLLAALMVQPLNIADMQPGVACTVTVIMSLLALPAAVMTGSGIHLALLIMVVALAYSPLDYRGKIMMGEVGNHSFAVALGLLFYISGGPWLLLALFLLTPLVTAILRRGNLSEFLEKRLKIENPTLGDLYMDVMTGGGLGDLLRRILMGRRAFRIRNPFLISLGFRRLLFNPHASHVSRGEL